MVERKSVLMALAFCTLALVSVPSILFNNAIRKYFSFVGNWSVASVKPSRCAQLPPMHPRISSQRADIAQPELRFVKFAVKIANAGSVRLAGDFNKWNQDSLALTRREKNSWGTILPLPPGVYHYLYNIDGQLILDPLNPDTAVIDGRKVSVMTVK